MKIVIFNDQPELLYPLTRLRPTWEVNVGGRSLAKGISERFLKAKLAFEQNSLPPVKKMAARQRPLQKDYEYTLRLNGRLLPNDQLFKFIEHCLKHEVKTSLKRKGVILLQGLDGQESKRKVSAKNIELLQAPWDLISYHDEILLQELNTKCLISNFNEVRPGVFTAKDIKLPQTCLTRTGQGQIIIEKGVSIGDYTILEGPLLIEAGVLIHDYAKISASRVGKISKVNGEILHVNFYEYGNKQHAGFAGYSVFGAWANLGGGTTTSTLKNTLGTIKMNNGTLIQDTKLALASSILGDFCKTGVNASLMPGLVADICAHLYGTVKGFTPAFTNNVNGQLTELPLKIALKANERSMQRRQVRLNFFSKKQLIKTFKQTEADRKKLKAKKGKLEL